jgi:hypothetical protein
VCNGKPEPMPFWRYLAKCAPDWLVSRGMNSNMDGHRGPIIWLPATLGIAVAAALLLKVPYFNGPWYWTWPWRDLSVYRGLILFGMPFLLFFYVVRGLENPDSLPDHRRSLGLLILSTLGMQVMAIAMDPGGFPVLKQIVLSPTATSYYTDALRIRALPDWMRTFDQAELELHSSTHPPGPIVYYYFFLGLFGTEIGAYVGAWSLAVLASLGVMVVYRFSALWTEDPHARIISCAIYSMMPGLLLFLPSFDIVYPALAMLLMTFWVEGLHRSSRGCLLFGVTLFVSCLFAYNLLAIGSFIVLYSAHFVRQRGYRLAVWKRLAVTILKSAATTVGLYLLLWMATGFNPVDSFFQALRNQSSHAGGLGRPYLACVWFDVFDFIMGGGVVPFALVLAALVSGGTEMDKNRLTSLGIASIALVDLTGLLRCETARVWLFLQPLVVVPAALVLSRVRPLEKTMLLSLQWLIVVVIKCRLHYVFP